MVNFTTVHNNFENVTTLKGMLNVANAHTGGYTYIGLMIMVQMILLISLIPFGFEAAILSSAFISLVEIKLLLVFLKYIE